ncbi:hypothetical protein POM88_016476 [Heracleum sosnowskyi]|uniref:Endonuclease/exonuclease/phosphatase domain-containing protein n=1 Tax=Heracleum sosnowskyi TaxID=360622 RepID=A0AAD8INH0_9APIA|nr:hypothetical protein POM88_016476 [Heracleum sosnowskyi]
MDSAILLNWNIRGLGKEVNKKILRDTIFKCKPSVICIQETKVQNINAKQLVDLWPNVKPHGFCQASIGQSGGLVSTWDSVLYKLINYDNFFNWLGMTLQCKKSGLIFSIFNIYAPLLSKEREINSSNLKEIHLINASYTWIGPAGRRSRIDRALVNSAWYQQGAWVSKALYRKNSDHRPLLILLDEVNRGPKPFGFFNIWLKDPNSKNIMLSFLKETKDLGARDVQQILKVFKSKTK